MKSPVNETGTGPNSHQRHTRNPFFTSRDGQNILPGNHSTPFFNFPVQVPHAVPPSAQGTFIQRQARAGAPPSTPQTRAVHLIRQRDPLLAAMINNNPFDGSFAPTGTSLTINGQTHTWELAIRFNSRLDNNIGGHTSHQNPVTREVAGQNVTVHRLSIELNPRISVAGVDTAFRARMRNRRQRFHFFMAENLYHELVHARILMEREFPQTDRSQVYNNYESLLGSANSAALRNHKTRVLGAIIAFGRAVNVLNISNAQIAGLFQQAINEKAVSNRTSRVFGRNRSNLSIAREGVALSFMYLKNLPGSIMNNPSTPEREELSNAYMALFDELDRVNRQNTASP